MAAAHAGRHADLARAGALGQPAARRVPPRADRHPDPPLWRDRRAGGRRWDSGLADPRRRHAVRIAARAKPGSRAPGPSAGATPRLRRCAVNRRSERLRAAARRHWPRRSAARSPSSAMRSATRCWLCPGRTRPLPCLTSKPCQSAGSYRGHVGILTRCLGGRRWVRDLAGVLVFLMRGRSGLRPDCRHGEHTDEPIGNLRNACGTVRSRRLQQAEPMSPAATAIVVPASAPLPQVPSARSIRSVPARPRRGRQRSRLRRAGPNRRPAARIRFDAAGLVTSGPAAGASAAACRHRLRSEPAMKLPSRRSACRSGIDAGSVVAASGLALRGRGRHVLRCHGTGTPTEASKPSRMWCWPLPSRCRPLDDAATRPVPPKHRRASATSRRVCRGHAGRRAAELSGGQYRWSASRGSLDVGMNLRHARPGRPALSTCESETAGPLLPTLPIAQRRLAPRRATARPPAACSTGPPDRPAALRTSARSAFEWKPPQSQVNFLREGLGIRLDGNDRMTVRLRKGVLGVYMQRKF